MQRVDRQTHPHEHVSPLAIVVEHDRVVALPARTLVAVAILAAAIHRSRGGPTRLTGERRQTQAKLERLQEAVERVLRRVVARIDRAQHVRAGHAHLGREPLTPIARITFPSASCRSTPSSIDASRNSRAKAASRRSFASPMFQSSLRLATASVLLIRLPRLLRPGHVRRLGGLVATEQQEHDLGAVLAEEDPISRPDMSRASQTPPPTLLWSPRFPVEKRSTLA